MDRQLAAQRADKEWLVEYDHAGARWGLDGFYALDEEDARQKLRAIGATGRVVFGPVEKSYRMHLPAPAVTSALLGAGVIFGAVLALVVLG